MLELLLMQYNDIFGEAFPLAEFDNKSEIELINILYECVQNNQKYSDGMVVTSSIEGPRS